MSWIVFSIFAAIIGLAGLYLFFFSRAKKGASGTSTTATTTTASRRTRFGPSEEEYFSRSNSGGLRIVSIVLIIVCLLWFLITPAFAFHQIPTGHIGIVYTFGNITGQTGEGGQWIAPWQSMRTESYQIQSYGTVNIPQDIVQKTSATDSVLPSGHMGAASSETQDVFIKATMNIQLAPDSIINLYRYVT
jgi:hypothetical protein